MINLKDLSQLRTLIVEDNVDDFILLLDYLTSFDITVIADRVDTEESLIAALSHPWDIIFSDFSMPNLNGLNALDIVRSINVDIPFIYLSGTIGESAAVNAIKSGAQDYIMKSDFPRIVPTIERELQEAINRREKRETEEKLRKMSTAIKQTADSVCILNAKGIIEYVNPAFETLTGYNLAEIEGKNPALLYADHGVSSDNDGSYSPPFNHTTYSGITVSRHKNGSLFHEERVVSPLYNDNHEISHFVSTSRDITARIAAETVRKRLQTVLTSTTDWVVIARESGAILYLNNASHDIFELARSYNITQDTLWTLLPEALSQQLRTEIFPEALSKGHWTGEVLVEPKLTSKPSIPVSLVVITNTEESDGTIFLSLIGRDITERKNLEFELKHQATHDSLTGLPNRYYLTEHLQKSIQEARLSNKKIAVLLMDIDKFKRINDNLGHASGDKLLQRVAALLRNTLPPGGTIARLGGDEFTILLNTIDSENDVIATLKNIFRIFRLPLQVAEQELFISLSIGIAMFPADGENDLDLLRHADIAMYKAKQTGSNQYQFYNHDMDAFGYELLQMDTELRYAITNKELCLFYQPQISTASGRLVGVEALLRWRSPSRGLVSPADFIPLLESSRLIISVGEWVIEQACRQYQRFCAAGRPDIRISVNVSAVQLHEPDFQDMVANITRQFNLPPAILELEITENVVMQDPARTADVLVALNKIGVHTAIDDFGTGYSSLAYLKRFPVETLKIDKSFITDLQDNQSDAAIIEASITMAHKLGMKVVAEGVEKPEQFVFLQKLDCDTIQGYLFSHPVPEDQILALLNKKFI